MSIEVTCPSGLRGVLRGMKVKDEQVWTDKKLVHSGRAITVLLSNCWEETLDPGPYSTDGKLDFSTMLSADRTFLLIQLRVASYGADYEFSRLCPACDRMYGWSLNLIDELPVTPVSAQGLAHVRSGEHIPLTLLDGRQALCRLLTGQDEAFMATLNIKEQPRLLAYQLARRIAEIDGAKNWRSVLPVIEDMEARVADDLWDKTDELEGGIDTMLSTECSHCGRIVETILPFGTEFFSTSRRFGRSKRRKTG